MSSKSSAKSLNIQKILLLTFMAIGLAMGLLFPVFAQFFVDWKEGMFIWFVLGCITAGLMVGVINYAIVKHLLISRLMGITNFAKAISDGEVSKRCDLDSNGEVGEIIKSLNSMAIQLEDSIAKVTNDSRNIFDSADEMNQAAKNTKHILSTQEDVINKVVDSVSDLTNSVKNVSEKTKDASNAAESAKEETDRGNKVLSKTINSINSVAKEVEKSAAVIHDLESDSEQIGKVLEVIQAIAEQTNLLALNAAIEAARAGDMGRGFAVVADEVRTLAQRTQESTQEIRQVVEHLQDGTSNAVKAMENSQALSIESVENAAEVDDSFNSISESVQQISGINAEIVRDVDEQNAIAEFTSHSTDEIKELTKQTSKNIDSTENASNQMVDLTKSLQKVLQYFKLLPK